MEKHVEEPSDEKSINRYFYLLGAVFGGLTGGFTQESFLGTIAGAVVGLLIAGLFVGNLLKRRQHDR